MIGRTLGHYRILEKLGAGGMGVVYVAQDTLLGRKAAVKVIKDGTTADETARARLLREARLASALNHPNICTVYEIGVDSSDAQQTYIAMELIEGRPLSTVIPAEGLPFDQVFRYAAQIAEALAHAHDRGVIHRDLKSANVMVLPDGRLKVLDFGLAKQMEQAADATTLIHEEALTRAGVIVGTLAYMSPEAVRGGPVDARSDIWSLGVLLYEMASGWRPFQGTTLLDLTAAILRDAVPESSAHACRQLHPILQRCLAKDPAQRYQSVGEMRVALDAIWSPQNRPAVAAKILDRRKWLWVAGGALALGLALAGRIWLWSPPRAKAPLPSTIPEANEYLRLAQNALETGQDAERIRQLSEQALKLDPKFAAARVLYAFGHLLEVDGGRSHDRTWLYRAEEELDRALQDDPTSARAHAVRAFVYLYQGRKDLIPAEAGKALELDPNEIDGYMMMAFYHQLNGEFEQSQKLLQKVLDEFDPLFTPALSNFGENLRLMGNPEGAIKVHLKLREQDPRNVLFWAPQLAQAYMNVKDLPRARHVLEEARKQEQRNYYVRLCWALQLALEGKRDEAEREMDRDVLKWGEFVYFGLLTAEFYAVLENKSEALDRLEIDFLAGDERSEWFARDPLLANVREEPRFQEILKSVRSRRDQRAPTKD